jgi:hypothetical protein
MPLGWSCQLYAKNSSAPLALLFFVATGFLSGDSIDSREIVSRFI